MTTTDDTTTTAPTALPLAAGAWTLDPMHSAVGFTVRHLGISKVRGRFARFDAALEVGETAAACAVRATIELASIDTGNPDRDAHVTGAELLDAARRPTMEFRSTRISGAGEDWEMAGDLTIGGVTREVVLAVEFGGARRFAGTDADHAGFEAVGEIRRSDFGLSFGTAGDAIVADTVRLSLDMQFTAP